MWRLWSPWIWNLKMVNLQMIDLVVKKKETAHLFPRQTALLLGKIPSGLAFRSSTSLVEGSAAVDDVLCSALSAWLAQMAGYKGGMKWGSWEMAGVLGGGMNIYKRLQIFVVISDASCCHFLFGFCDESAIAGASSESEWPGIRGIVFFWWWPEMFTESRGLASNVMYRTCCFFK